MRRRTTILLVLGACAMSAGADEPGTGFLDRVYKDDAGEHQYVLFVPRGYTPEKRWPLILFLHGAGERGVDGKKPAQVGLAPAIRKRPDFPFLAVFPQCEDVETRPVRGWAADGPDARRAMRILDEVERQYKVDPDRVYLTGLSMGGFGCFSLAAKDPDRWAAVAPVCGGGRKEWAPTIARLPFWIFHGGADAVVPPQLSRTMVEALREAGAEPRYTEYEGVGHNSWDKAYATDELYDWFLAHPRKR